MAEADRRCQKAGCTKGTQDDTDYCKAHGGGRQCQKAGCLTAAQSGKQRCHAHGGGTHCQQEGCSKSARGSTRYCVAHGGGKRCQQEGCTKPVAQAPGSVYYSPTMRKSAHCNSLARGRHQAKKSTGGGWRVRGHPQATSCSNCSDVYVDDFTLLAVHIRVHTTAEPRASRVRRRDCPNLSAPPQGGRCRLPTRIHHCNVCHSTLQDFSWPPLKAGQLLGSHSSPTVRGALGAAWTARVSR
jgi:hypothetical protein